MKIRNIFMSIGAFAAISAPLITSFSATIDTHSSIIYDNRNFANEDEVLNYMVSKGIVNINKDKVVGNFANAFANVETGVLNKYQLPDYNPENMNFAYVKAGGGLTSDYDGAKNTYFGPIEHKYSDGFGHTFEEETDAKSSMNSFYSDFSLGTYNVEYIDPNSSSNSVSTKINPFNEKDIMDYEKNIADNIELILNDNIWKNNPLYNIRLAKNPAPDENNLNPLGSINIGKLLKQYNSSIICNSNTNEISLETEESANIHWKFDKEKIGNNGKYDDDKEHGIKPNFKYHLKNHGDGDYFQWLQGDFNNVDKTSLEKFLMMKDLGSDINIKWNSKNNVNIKSNNTDLKNIISSFTNVRANDIDTMKRRLGEPYISFEDTEFSNQLIKATWGKVLAALKHDSTENCKYSISYTGLPNFRDWHIEKFWHWYSSWDKNDYISFGDLDDKADYTAKTTFTFNNLNIDSSLNVLDIIKQTKDKTNNSPVNIIVSKDGLDLFDGELVKLKDKIVLENLEISKTNKDGLNGLDKLATEAFLDFSKNIEIAKNSRSINDAKNVFEKLEKDDSLRKLIDEDTSVNKYKNINANVAIECFLNSLWKTYIKFKNDNSLIFQLLNRIPKNVAILNGGTHPFKNDMYTMSSLASFNPSLVMSPDIAKEKHEDFDKAKEMLGKIEPAKISIVRDSNNQIVDIGDYKFDSESVIKFNFLNSFDIPIDNRYIYVNGYNEPFDNVITNIFRLSLDNKEVYFNSFRNLKAYIIKYIKNNSTFF